MAVAVYEAGRDREPGAIDHGIGGAREIADSFDAPIVKPHVGADGCAAAAIYHSPATENAGHEAFSMSRPGFELCSVSAREMARAVRTTSCASEIELSSPIWTIVPEILSAAATCPDPSKIGAPTQRWPISSSSSSIAYPNLLARANSSFSLRIEWIEL